MKYYEWFYSDYITDQEAVCCMYAVWEFSPLFHFASVLALKDDAFFDWGIHQDYGIFGCGKEGGRV